MDSAVSAASTAETAVFKCTGIYCRISSAAAMGEVVFDRWNKLRDRGGKNKGLLDLAESPLVCKGIGAPTAPNRVKLPTREPNA